MSKKNPGWRKDYDRHALASRGIRTSLNKVRNSKKKTLPKKWLTNRIDRQPYREHIKKWASEIYDDIDKNIKDGKYFIKDGEILEKKYSKHLGKEVETGIYIKHRGLMKGIKGWDKKIDEVESFDKKGDGNVITYIAYHLVDVLEPIENWLYDNYDLKFNIYSYRGESVHCEIVDDGWDYIKDSKDLKKTRKYRDKYLGYRGEGTGEFDLYFIYDIVMPAYIESKNKTEFKDRVADSIRDELLNMSKKTIDKVRDGIKSGEFDKYKKELNKIKGVDKR